MYKETHPVFEKHANEFFVVDVTIPVLVSKPHQLLSLKLIQLNMLFDIFLKNVLINFGKPYPQDPSECLSNLK